MVEVRVLLENKKKLASQCIAAGLLGEFINLMVFLNSPVLKEDDNGEDEEDVDEPEEEVTESPFNHLKEEIAGLQHFTQLNLFLTIAFGIVAIVAFLLFLLECCKQNEIMDGVLSQKDNWKSEAEELKKKVDEVKDQVATLKIDVLEDLEANLFGSKRDKIDNQNDNNDGIRDDNNNNNESQETKSELILTPKQVSWMSPEETIGTIGSLPQIRLEYGPKTAVEWLKVGGEYRRGSPTPRGTPANYSSPPSTPAPPPPEFLTLQSVEEARPVKASEVGEQMEAEKTEGSKREANAEVELWTPLDTHTTL